MAAEAEETGLRWERLFDDLEAQAVSLAHAERAAEIAERSRIESGRLQLRHRFDVSLGADLQLRLAGGSSVGGQLRRTGRDWLLLADRNGGECLVATPHVLLAGGLTRWSAPAESADADRVHRTDRVRFSIGHVLRALCVDRAPVALHLLDGSAISATIDRVGRDFLDVAIHVQGEVVGRGKASAMVVARDAIPMIRRLP